MSGPLSPAPKNPASLASGPSLHKIACSLPHFAISDTDSRRQSGARRAAIESYCFCSTLILFCAPLDDARKGLAQVVRGQMGCLQVFLGVLQITSGISFMFWGFGRVFKICKVCVTPETDVYLLSSLTLLKEWRVSFELNCSCSYNGLTTV